jgi:hypothetical protein
VKQNRCKDGVLIRKYNENLAWAQDMLANWFCLKKHSPHRASANYANSNAMKLQNASPPLTQLSGGTAYRLHGSAWRLRCSRRAEGGLGLKVSQPHDLRICIISKRHLKGERTKVN